MSESEENIGSDTLDHIDEKKLKSREASKKYYDKKSRNPLFKLRRSLAKLKCRKKKKNQDMLKMMSEKGGFPSRDGLLKKKREAEKHLPKDPLRAAQVVHELSQKYPLPSNETDEKKKKPLSDAEKRVKEFYESEENVVILPGINDYVVRRDENNQKVKMQKNILKDSVRNMYSKFAVSVSKFFSKKLNFDS